MLYVWVPYYFGSRAMISGYLILHLLHHAGLLCLLVACLEIPSLCDDVAVSHKLTLPLLTSYSPSPVLHQLHTIHWGPLE